MPLNHIRIVLVQPSHGGNIGGCARAMKNMGLTRLVLVAPEDFPGEEASARAAGADDVLAQALLYATLDEAIADCHLVIGASARDRHIAWPRLTPDAAARRMVSATAGQEVAVLFGRERTGLTNEEMELCKALVHIPTNPEYSSLNVAAAVQVLCYEVRMAFLASSEDRPLKTKTAKEDMPATTDQMEGMYEHLYQTMEDIKFFGTSNPDVIMRRLKGLFNRAQTTKREVAPPWIPPGYPPVTGWLRWEKCPGSRQGRRL